MSLVYPGEEYEPNYQQETPACACTQIVYAPKHLLGGLLVDQWICRDCGRQFTKVNPEDKILGADVTAIQTIDDLPGGSTPSQYALPPGATELQDLIEYREMNFAMGNIFKACYRKKDVGDPLYDIRKIIWFAKREEARLTKEANNG